MYKEDLALDYQQWLICHKAKRNQTKTITGGDREAHTFLKSISQKVNLILRLEFKFANYDVTVQHGNAGLGKECVGVYMCVCMCVLVSVNMCV